MFSAKTCIDLIKFLEKIIYLTRIDTRAIIVYTKHDKLGASLFSASCALYIPTTADISSLVRL